MEPTRIRVWIARQPQIAQPVFMQMKVEAVVQDVDPTPFVGALHALDSLGVVTEAAALRTSKCRGDCARLAVCRNLNKPSWRTATSRSSGM